MRWNNRVEKTKKKIRKEFVILSLLMGAIIGVYLVGCFYYNERFMNLTYINDVDVSGLTLDKANEKLAKTIDDNTLSLEFNDGNVEKIFGRDFGVKYNIDNDVRKILKKQNSFTWVTSYFTKSKETVDNLVAVDETILANQINSLSHLQPDFQVAPVDAIIEYVDQKYTIKNEVMGSTIDTTKLIKAIKMSFSEGKDSLNLEQEQCYVLPAVRADDEKLQQNFNTLNQYASAVITYQTRKGDVVLDGETLIDWLSVDEAGNYYHDENVFKKNAKEFVDNLAKKVNSLGETRTFVGANNRTITVSGGNYGLRLQNAKEVNGLLNDIYAKKVGVRTPVTTGKEVTNDNGGLGNTFVEIDLTNQHMWYHKNGQIIVESDIVSGTYNNLDRRTPAGTYYLYNKERNRVLRGTKKPDGTWPYETPVSYWMPFNRGIGLHDSSTWRKKWGGDIYLNNGSHGCINLPTSAAAQLYNNIEVNCPVVCYY